MIRREAAWLLIGLTMVTLSAKQTSAQTGPLALPDFEASTGWEGGCFLTDDEAACLRRASEHGFFPPGTFRSDKQSRYSEFLTALAESAIYRTNKEGFEAYRFLWLQLEFGPSVALRIQNENGEKSLVIKQKGVVRVHRRRLGAREWNEFVMLLEGANYWQLQTETSVQGLDGAQWVLEGVKDGRYHIVDRWSPEAMRSPTEQDLNYRGACEYLLRLSGFGAWLSHP